MADRELRAAVTFLTMLGDVLDATRDGVVVLGKDDEILACNTTFLSLFDLGPEAATSAPRIRRALTEGRLERLDEAEYDTLTRADGRVYHVWTAPIGSGRAAAGQVITVRDATAMARQESEVDELRQLLEKAEAVAGVGSWVAELDDTDRLFWSPEMYRISGRQSAPSRREAMHVIVHPDDREAVRRERDTALGAGPSFSIEHRILRPDGSVRWVQTRGELARDEQGRPVRMMGTMQDVTERRWLEDELRQSRKLEALGRLAGGVAHDINNALTAIVGYAEQAGEALTTRPAVNNTPEAIALDLEEIQQAAGRGVAVTRQLLSFSRKEALAPRLFNLQEAVHTMERMLARTLGPSIELRTLIEHGVPPVYGDRAQVEQTIVNLAINARDAMADGGTLTLTIALRTFDADTVLEPARAGRFVELGVTDTGHGMDAETRVRVFEPFFTTKGPGHGTGLGLAMADATIKQSGGFIFVDSEPGKGTSVRVYFPAPPRDLPSTPTDHRVGATAPDRTPASRAGTILVAEDEPSVLRLIATTLRRDGHQVFESANAEAALAIADSGVAEFELLVTDINMPGWSGLDLASAMAERYPGIAIIVTTGFAPDSVIAPRVGSSTKVLAKPFTPRELRRAVRQALAPRE